MHQVKKHNCNTCKGIVDAGKYCPDCGLHNTGKKSGLWNFILEGVEQIVSLEKGFIQGFKNSMLYPKNIVIDYYNGYRNHSPSPGKMVLYTLLSLGILFLIFGRIGVLDVTIGGEEKDDFNALKIFMISLIPFMIISSKLLYWSSFKGWVIHMISIAFLFLPRFILLVITFAIVSVKSEEPTLFILLGLVFTLLWFFYTNALALNKEDIGKRVLLAIAHFAIFIGLILVVLIIPVLSTTAEVHVG